MQKSNYKKTKFIILSFLFILFFNYSSSQIDFGVKAGLSFNSGLNQSYFFESENMTHNLFEKNSGFQLGLYSKVKILNSFFIQPEIYYSSIKRKYDITFPLDHEMYVVDEYKQERIIVPVLIGIDLFDKVSLFIGPNFSFKSDVFFEENNEKITLKYLYDKSNIYLQYGISINFKKITIDFRIEKGKNDREIKIVENITEQINQIVQSDDLLTMVSLGYKF